MRGKTIDTEFVASFIQDCIKNNKITPDEICEEAIHQMDIIDEQLRLRTKLTDVLSNFNFKKRTKIVKKNLDALDKIDKNICNDIFSLLKNEPIALDSVLSEFSKFNDKYKQDMIFTFKQLLASAVLVRTPENNIIKGELFNNFNESKI